MKYLILKGANPNIEDKVKEDEYFALQFPSLPIFF